MVSENVVSSVCRVAMVVLVASLAAGAIAQQPVPASGSPSLLVDASLAEAFFARSSLSPELIAFSIPAEEQERWAKDWADDLRVLDWLIRPSVSDVSPGQRAMGVSVGMNSQQGEALYLEGFGVVMRYRVPAVLVGDEQNKAPQTQEATLSEWERTKRELGGRGMQQAQSSSFGGPVLDVPLLYGMGIAEGGARTATAYDQKLVATMIEATSAAISEGGRNIGGLSDGEQIVVVLHGTPANQRIGSLTLRGRISKDGGKQGLAGSVEVIKRTLPIRSSPHPNIYFPPAAR